MTFYPVVGVLTYKDKKVDVKIQMRAQLIKVNKISCEKCGINTTWMKMYQFWQANMFEKKYSRIKNPITKSRVVCPKCRKEMNWDIKELVKVYCFDKEYVKVIELITQFTGFRWKEDSLHHSDTVKFATYCDDLKTVWGGLEYLKKNKKAKMKITKVQMRTLRRLLKEYTARKVAKQI